MHTPIACCTSAFSRTADGTGRNLRVGSKGVVLLRVVKTDPVPHSPRRKNARACVRYMRVVLEKAGVHPICFSPNAARHYAQGALEHTSAT